MRVALCGNTLELVNEADCGRRGAAPLNEWEEEGGGRRREEERVEVCVVYGRLPRAAMLMMLAVVQDALYSTPICLQQ